MFHISRFWNYLTAPDFDATTETHVKGAVTLIAGQRTRICTIKLSLAAEGKFGNYQEEIVFPRPSFLSVPPGVQVSFGEDRRPRREVLELDVYVQVKSAGTYSIIPEYSEGRYNFRSIDKKAVDIDVKPSELKFVKVSGIAPIPGHGKAGSVYRGGTVEIRVRAKDEFENFITAESDLDLNFNIPPCSLSVTLLSHALNTHYKKFFVKIRCDKVGKGSFKLIASQGSCQVRKNISLEVIPPPVSAAKSYIIQSDIDEIRERLFDAGQAITFKLQLIDVLGNPIPSEKSVQHQDQFHLHHQNYTSYPNWSGDTRYSTENGRSLRVRPSEVDSNICEIEFTPSEAGKRQYSFSIAGQKLTRFQFRIAVLPREGDKSQIIQNKTYLDRETSENLYEARKGIPYNKEEYLEFYECDQKILCLGVQRRHLVGEDNANIKNINRVLENEYPSCKLSKDLVSWKYGLLVVFDLSSFQKNAALEVCHLLSDLVEGRQHYRNEADKFAKEREKWDEKEKEAKENMEKSCKDFEEELEKLEEEYEEVEDENEEFEKDVEELEYDYEELEYGGEDLKDVDEEFEKEVQELEHYYDELEKKYRIEAHKCRRLKLECGRAIHESNERASGAIFKFYNCKRPQSEIDLHGQRVGNQVKLEELEANLRRENKTPVMIEEIMERERLKRDEAIRKLDERLRNFDHDEAKRVGEDWLEIIDGAGHHSARRGEQKIRPKVKEYLGRKNIEYVEANEGALLITFSEYTGKEPCIADFYCKTCTRTWTSATSWKGFYQNCYSCYKKGTNSNCYPFKLRSLAVLPKRRGQNNDQFKDHRRLCQKCIQLGRDCRRQR